MNADAPIETEFKWCSRCGTEQSVNDFQWKNKARGLRRSWCRPCALAYSHQHYVQNVEKYKAKARLRTRSDRRRNRALVDAYLRSHPCVDCGASDTAILEFDHRDPATKRTDIATVAQNAGWATALAKLAKCDVRCANCHRRRTARQFSWAKLRVTAPGAPPADPPVSVGRAPADPDFLRACIWCSELKPLSGFAFKNTATGTLNSHCRQCHAAYRRQHYLDNKADYFRRAIAQTRRKAAEAKERLHAYLLAHPCVDCGEKNLAVLDFDHVDPSTKTRAVAQMVGHRTWHSIQVEIDKCEVRCANCHRRRTLAQRGMA